MPNSGSRTALPQKIISGIHEQLIPYYDEVVCLGFNGKSFVEIYPWLYDNEYTCAATHDLTDADEVLILDNGNGALNSTSIGSENDTTATTYCGALNKIIDLVFARNTDHAVRVFLATRYNQYSASDSDTRESQSRDNYNAAKLRHEKMRAIAQKRNLRLIDAEDCGLNEYNYRYYSYDSDRDIYYPYGGHPNNAGNNLLGQITLDGLLK